MGEPVTVRGVSNEEFLSTHARAGRVGLAGGVTLVDRVIRRAERHLEPDHVAWGRWTHAWIFEGERADGRHWVVESDLQVKRRHISLGVQENRIEKYHDGALYPWLAVLDFRLAEEQVSGVLSGALDLVAARTRYSLRELLGTYIALRRPELRGRGNVLDQDRSLYCSAFVHRVFTGVGIDLAPGVHGKNTAPEDISRTPVPHDTWISLGQA
jgi:hypothetical protein